MFNIRIVSNGEECKAIWENIYPQETLFDLWEFRNCFAEEYCREMYFIVVENDSKVAGLLPLVYANEINQYVFFPGELWNSKTWIEQNKIIADSPETYKLLLDNIPANTYIRYLCKPDFEPHEHSFDIDETGFLFFPGEYDFTLKNYFENFPSKFRKNFRREIDSIVRAGAVFRYDCFEDIRVMFEMNISKYGEKSYFYDSKFCNSFQKVFQWALSRNSLKIATIILNDEILAIDIGIIWNNGYTVLSGIANNSYKGVSKLINLHHISLACGQRLKYIDFLCGDFGWKEKFMLTPRNLYKYVC